MTGAERREVSRALALGENGLAVIESLAGLFDTVACDPADFAAVQESVRAAVTDALEHAASIADELSKARALLGLPR